MNFRRSFNAPIAILLAAVLLVGCGSQATPSSTPPVPVASASAADDPVARAAFGAAICPIFDGILEIDPRLAAMRAAGSAGGDMSAQAAEIDAVDDQLVGLLTSLEEVPEWSSGAGLRFQLISALHAIHANLLVIGEDATLATTADELAALPFIATTAMDRAMQDAVDNGLSCEGAP